MVKNDREFQCTLPTLPFEGAKSIKSTFQTNRTPLLYTSIREAVQRRKSEGQN